jgi:hypothetical protein
MSFFFLTASQQRLLSRSILSALLTTTCLPACSGDEEHGEDHDHGSDSQADTGTGSNNEVCSGHGHLHGDECHCDDGYQVSEDGTACVATDMDPSPDAGTDADQAPDSLDLSSAMLTARTGTDSEDKQVWVIEAVEDTWLLQVELYESFGGPTSTGTVSITENETNYATCGTCLLLQTGCEAHGDHFHCNGTWMPIAQGELHLDVLDAEVGGRIEGDTHDIVFQEVVIDEDLNTLPVPDGRRMALEDLQFALTLDSLQSEPTEECGGHGHLHGSACHCDDGYQVDPDDSANCIPE